MTSQRLVRIPAIAILALTLQAGAAAATPIFYGLDKNNGNVTDADPFGWGYVEVNLTSSTTADIAFLEEAGSPWSYGDPAGDNSANDNLWHLVAVNVNGPSTVSNIASAPSIGTVVALGSEVFDNIGTYSQTLQDDGTAASLLTEVSFTLTLTSGTWSSSSDVLENNDHGHVAAARVEDAAGDIMWIDNDSLGPSTTGPATVPEPTTLVLLASGLAVASARLTRTRRK